MALQSITTGHANRSGITIGKIFVMENNAATYKTASMNFRGMPRRIQIAQRHIEIIDTYSQRTENGIRKGIAKHSHFAKASLARALNGVTFADGVVRVDNGLRPETGGLHHLSV